MIVTTFVYKTFPRAIRLVMLRLSPEPDTKFVAVPAVTARAASVELVAKALVSD